MIFLLFLLVTVGVGVVAAKLIADFAKRRGRCYLGIHVGPIACPRCDQQLPMVRRPENVQQALWGGWTCSACGGELDKYGTQIGRRDDSFELSSDKSPVQRLIDE